jgi:hypothetical protein
VDIPATSDNIPGTLVLRGATGDVKIGVASPAPHVTAPLTVTGGSTSGAALATYVYGSANAGITSYRANGTVESPTQVLSGERFAFLVGGTYGTTGFANPAAMNFHAAENQTDTARGSFITFDTCAVGQSGRQERLRIDASGRVLVGTVNTSGRLTVESPTSQFALTPGDSRKVALFNYDNDIFNIGVEDGYAVSAIAFRNNAQERMRINASGNVGIGTANPNTRVEIFGGNLSINSSSQPAIHWRTGSNTLRFAMFENGGFLDIGRYNDAGAYVSSPVSISRASGEVFMGGATDQGAYNLQVGGTGVWGAGAYINGSDERLKDNISEITEGLEVVKKLRPVSFNYKPTHSKDTSKQAGFIAQELLVALEGKDYLEGTVQQGPEFYNVAYQNLIPVMAKAIQELTAKVEALEAAQ